MESRDHSYLKKIRLKTKRKITNLFSGEYHSAFKGQGLEFESVREYAYGDEVRSIDWNVSARMNHLYIKEYSEERELSIVLLLDVSASNDFGSSKSKKELMMEAASLFLYLAQMNNDRVSVVLFSDRVEKYIRPRKGRKFILNAIDEIEKCHPSSSKTDLSAAVDFLRMVMKKRSVVFFVSDFLDRGDYLLKLKHLSRRHDIIPVHLSDRMEREMNISGLAEFTDLETGETFLSDSVPSDNNFKLFDSMDSIILDTAAPIEMPILKFFEKRNRSRHTHA